MYLVNRMKHRINNTTSYPRGLIHSDWKVSGRIQAWVHEDDQGPDPLLRETP